MEAAQRAVLLTTESRLAKIAGIPESGPAIPSTYPMIVIRVPKLWQEYDPDLQGKIAVSCIPALHADLIAHRLAVPSIAEFQANISLYACTNLIAFYPTAAEAQTRSLLCNSTILP